ncbi:hypothetical protein BT93_I1516 [Corymbia citriodora subsp. variegata]|nr:hypothetical protein BT93_I1516 [Corymbia citriodora subsp. variegata]
MEMEVAVPPPNMEFNFDSTSSSPFMTAPSSPQRFGSLYFSAPTSPTRASVFLRELRNSRKSLSSIPFAWEEKPGVPKRRGSDQNGGDGDDDDDFEFDFSGQLDRASASADELFDGGKIKPLKPPPRLQANSGDADSTINSLPASPRSPSRFAQGRKMVQEALSPRHHKRDFDPFSAALEETRKRQTNLNQHEDLSRPRGRERKAGFSSSARSSSASYVRKGTRSLSPLRVSDIMEADREAEDRAAPSSSSSSSNHGSSYFSSLLSSISFSKGYRKWSFKDFLLFRSASEGRGTEKDPLRKYEALSKRSSFNYVAADDVKSSSFRSTESVGSVSSRRRSGAAPVSAHELHYTLNRAVSEEMKKKTSLPYKHGLLGCLGFDPPPGVHDLARVLGR